jgi:exonuclease SbcC
MISMETVIKLKKISLANFRGIKSQTFEFLNRETTIVGANGTGKSSLFDAFVWTLFGKDSKGRADYQLKTLDEQGNVIHRQDCDVEVVLNVNESELRLRRIYSENWVRPKGAPEDQMKGHSTEYLINDVSVKKSEYDIEIAKLCSEDVFRVITNPTYFPNLMKDDQRKLLFSMVGDIPDSKIAEGKPDFEELLDTVQKTSWAAFKSEIESKKKRIKSDIEFIPSRIEELNTTIPKALDWDSIEASIKEKKAEIEAIDSQLIDISKASEEENKTILGFRNQINELERANQTIKFEEQQKIDNQINELKEQSRKLLIQAGERNRGFKEASARLDYLNKEKERLEAQLGVLGEEWKQINARRLEFNDSEFACPTCKRPLEMHDIEAKQCELTENFNKEKAALLKSNTDRGGLIAQSLKSVKVEIESIGEIKEQDVSDINAQINEIKEKIESLSKAPVNIEQNAAYISNMEKISELTEAVSTRPSLKTGNESLIAKKKELTAELDELKNQLGQKSIIENTAKRVADLSKQYDEMNQELANLEKKEFMMKEFDFEKNRQYEKAINAMFKIVKFKLFHTQVDGQVVPTCEAMMDGVPYSTKNTAGQLAMGLDIIDTICKHNGVYAPIFLDNRESVSQIPEIRAQVINLVVDSNEKVLRIL